MGTHKERRRKEEDGTRIKGWGIYRKRNKRVGTHGMRKKEGE